MEFHARSLTIKTYIPSLEILSPLLYVAPFNVAQERLVSLKVMDLFPE